MTQLASARPTSQTPSDYLVMLDRLSDDSGNLRAQTAKAIAAVDGQKGTFRKAYLEALHASELQSAEAFNGFFRTVWESSAQPWATLFAMNAGNQVGALLLLVYYFFAGMFVVILPTVLGLTILDVLGLPANALMVPVLFLLWILVGARVALFGVNLVTGGLQQKKILDNQTFSGMSSVEIAIFVPTGRNDAGSVHPIAGVELTGSGLWRVWNYFAFGNQIKDFTPYLVVLIDSKVQYVQALVDGSVAYWNSNQFLETRGRVFGENIQAHLSQIPLVAAVTERAAAEVRQYQCDQAVNGRSAVKAQLQALEAFPGFESLRPFVNEVVAEYVYATTQGKRPAPIGHIVLTGNAGTGKTTMARQLFSLLASMGICQQNAFVEASRSTLVGQAIGETEKLTAAAIAKAQGGVFFIDEAYALAASPTNTNDFGPKAIEVLLKSMEDSRESFTVIVAGYPKEMADFIATNPGLKSRFKHNLDIPDFNAEDLSRVFISLSAAEGLSLSPSAKSALLQSCKALVLSKTKGFGNARAARNMLDQVKSAQRRRVLLDHAGANLSNQIEVADFGDDSSKQSRDEILTEAMGKLNSMVGLSQVKAQIRKIQNSLSFQEKTGSVERINKHFVFSGNPGTGKTEVARILGDILYGMGMLPRRHVELADRSKLVAQYRGQTGPQTHTICDKAMGGVLFIDEAYMLTNTGEQGDWGQEAVDTLLQRMENDRGKFVVIVAGYTQQMSEFLRSNPGLRSRFSDTIAFEDYAPAEMLSIFKGMAKTYQISQAADECALREFQRMHQKRGKDFANARDVRQFFERAVERMQERLMASNMASSGRVELLHEDLVEPNVRAGASATTGALARLNSLIGLHGVKEQIATISDVLAFDAERGALGGMAQHFVFTGKPGTGKTTVARLFAEILFDLGVISENKVIEVDRSGLVVGLVGKTATQTNKVCDDALGGVLFIDEAYALTDTGVSNDLGPEAVNALLKRMEDDRGKFVVIVAGYENKMNDFLASNPGLTSRFTNYIHFEDYTPSELLTIVEGVIKPSIFGDDARDALHKGLVAKYSHPLDDFANGREARNIGVALSTAMKSRVMAQRRAGVVANMQEEKISVADVRKVMPELTLSEVPLNFEAPSHEQTPRAHKKKTRGAQHAAALGLLAPVLESASKKTTH